MYIFVVTYDMSIDVPYYCPFIMRACDPASGWSLAIGHHVFLLVTCRVACYTVLLYFLLSAFTGDCASSWSLATGSNADVLVTCMVACAESGVSWKSLVLEKSIQLHQATWASAWSLAINFNGNQGGHLSNCCRELCTCT